jgi:hypothetical protein
MIVLLSNKLVLAKELDNFKCNLSKKFVAGGIIAKLPPS